MKAMKRLRIFNYLVIIQIIISGLIEEITAKRNSGEMFGSLGGVHTIRQARNRIFHPLR